MKEYEMSKPLCDWLRAKGYTIYCEVPFAKSSARSIDIVGRKDQELIAIEMKVRLSNALYNQAIHLPTIFNRVYAGVAGIPETNKEKFRRRGIGILSVMKYDRVRIVLGPKPCNPSEYLAMEMHERLNSHPEGGVAGHQARKGIGPGIECCKRVKEYLQSHPKARWPEIYRNVKNHYTSVASMRTAMAERQGFSLNEFRKQEFKYELSQGPMEHF